MNPPVSVITVCRNALAELKATSDSVLSQSSRDFEWIIIDGASSDGTREWLEDRDQPWIRWRSEPDTGIYDAMNKGLKMARGDGVWFMNAGDGLLDADCVGRVVQALPESDIVFGEVRIIGSDGQDMGPRSQVTPHHLPGTLHRDHFRLGMVVSHQAFVVKRSLAPEFDTKRYRYSADLDWMLRILAEEPTSQNLGTLARVLRDGATLRNWKRSQWERFRILSEHFGIFTTLGNHLKIVLRRSVHFGKTGQLR